MMAKYSVKFTLMATNCVEYMEKMDIKPSKYNLFYICSFTIAIFYEILISLLKQVETWVKILLNFKNK